MRPEALRAGSNVAGGDPDRDHAPKRSDPHAVVFLEFLISTGAVTEVWHARTVSGVPLAVKRHAAGIETAAHAQWLLEREALLLSRLSHPALVGTHGVLAPGRVAEASGESSERPGLALEYLSGGDLVGLAGSHPRHWVVAAQRVLDVVRHLHATGFVHGDIKARNVLFDARQQAKVIDLSSCLPVGSVCDAPLGTVSQQRQRSGGHTVSEDDDVFACAALVFELLTGELPFGDEAARAALQPSTIERRDGAPESSVADLQDIVCGMLRSASSLGPGELGRLAAALAAVERSASR